MLNVVNESCNEVETMGKDEAFISPVHLKTFEPDQRMVTTLRDCLTPRCIYYSDEN